MVRNYPYAEDFRRGLKAKSKLKKKKERKNKNKYKDKRCQDLHRASHVGMIERNK